MSLKIPPLRERIKDVPEIVNAIINNLNQSGFYIKGATYSTLVKLMEHSWPGNVRELQNIIARAQIYNQEITLMLMIFLPCPGSRGEISTASDGGGYNFKKRINITDKDTIMEALQEADRMGWE